VTARTLIDRNGRLHSAAVLDHWSPRMIEIMGVRECDLEQITGSTKAVSTPKAAGPAKYTGVSG